jgi:hypothetical protein
LDFLAFRFPLKKIIINWVISLPNMQCNLYPELSVLTLYPISVNANPNNPVVISRYITIVTTRPFSLPCN